MIIAIDTETTGLPKSYKAPLTDSANWPRMVQIGWIVFDKDTWEENELIIKVDEPIGDEVAKIHGITTEISQRDGEDLRLALSQICADMERCDTLLGHNIDFDAAIVGAEMHREKIFPKGDKLKRVCTMKCHKKWPKLQNLHKELFDVGFDGAHTALKDIEATVRCYKELVVRGVLDNYE